MELKGKQLNVPSNKCQLKQDDYLIKIKKFEIGYNDFFGEEIEEKLEIDDSN